MHLLCSGQRGLDNIHDLIMPGTTEIIMQTEYLTQSAMILSTFTSKIRRETVSYIILTFFSVCFLVVAVSSVKRRMVSNR
jgi:hypothetical protein